MNLDFLFNEFNYEIIVDGGNYYYLYPSPFKKFLFFLKKIKQIASHCDKNIDMFKFVYVEYENLNSIISNILNTYQEKLSEDALLNFLFKFIKINFIEQEETDKHQKNIFLLKDYLDIIDGLLNFCDEILKQYLKLKNNFYQDFGSISDEPKTYCKINGDICSPNCKNFFNECKHKAFSLKYLSLRGLYVLVYYVNQSGLEDKDFLCRIITGEGFLDKIENNRSFKIKKEFSLSEEEIEKVKETFLSELEKFYREKYEKLILIEDNFSFITSSGINEAKLTNSDILSFTLENPQYICYAIKYICFIKNNPVKNEFPYDKEFKPTNVKEELKTSKQIKNKNDYKYWSQERFDLFNEAFNNNDVVMLRITYDNFYWNWWLHHFKKKKINYEILMLKYIIDWFVIKFVKTAAYGIYIFESKENYEKLKQIITKIQECIKQYELDINDFFVEGEYYILDPDKLQEYLKNKQKDKLKSNEVKKKIEQSGKITHSISNKKLINNIDLFIKQNIIKRIT